MDRTAFCGERSLIHNQGVDLGIYGYAASRWLASGPSLAFPLVSASSVIG